MSSPPSPLRGDIWMVDFGQGRGSEQAGVRPAVVIQNDAGNRSLRYPNTVILAVSRKGRPLQGSTADDLGRVRISEIASSLRWILRNWARVIGASLNSPIP